MWIVYLIKSSTNNKYYCGVTTNMSRRLRQHNGEICGGAKATRSGRPWKLFYFEELDSRSDAQSREADIKKLSHREKSHLKK